MASAGFVLLEEEFHEMVLRLLASGSRIWCIVGISTEVDELTTNNFRSILTENVSLLVKHPSFAEDEPVVKTFERVDASWSMFVELQGDGHIEARSRRFMVFEKACVYVDIGYTSFFVRSSGEYINPPDALISLYRRTINILKKISTKTFIGSGSAFISTNIHKDKEKLIEEIKRNSGSF